MFIYKGIVILLALTVIVIFISTKPSKWTELFSLNIAWYTIGLFIVFSATSALWSLTPFNTLYKVLPLIAMAFLALIAVNFAVSLADNEIKALNTGIIYGGFLGFSILAIELIGQAHITQLLRASVGKFSGTPEQIYHIKNMLNGGVVGTLMSNYGLEKLFKEKKIKFIRTKVGDRYVKEAMKNSKCNLGGEQSGHIILGNFATTGDGILVALEVLYSMRKGKKASELFNNFKQIPQELVNITVKDKLIINSKNIKKSILNAKKLLKNNGRILVRPSGTEPKIRIMCESNDKNLMTKCINLVKRSIK